MYIWDVFGGWDFNLETIHQGTSNHAAESAKAITIPGIGQRFAILEPGENPQSNREFNRSWAQLGGEKMLGPDVIWKMINIIWQYMSEFQNFWELL